MSPGRMPQACGAWLFPFTKKSGDDARVAATVKYRQDKKGFFIRRVGNQEIPYGMNTQRPGSQIGTAVTQLRERDESLNRFKDCFKNAVSSDGIVSGDVFPNFVEVCKRLWMENKSAHAPRRSLLFWRSWLKAASPSTGCTRPLLISS